MGFTVTAKYPGAVATVTDLLNQANRLSTSTQPTLATAITSTGTSIVLGSGTGAILPTDNFCITIESEIILISSRTTDTLTVASGGRAYQGTTAASHIVGVNVDAYITARHHNQLASEVNAIETQLGVNLANVILASKLGAASGVATLDASAHLNAAQMPALTGDVTTPGGTLASTLASIVTAGTHTKVTYDAKGRVTAGVQAAFSDLTGNIAVTQMNSGTGASASTFWRGDNSWGTPAGGGSSNYAVHSDDTSYSVSTATTAYQNMMTWSIAAGSMDVAGAMYRFIASGSFDYQGGSSGISFVQSKNSSVTTTATSTTVTTTSTGLGNLLVCLVSGFGTGYTASVSDNQGNTWVQHATTAFASGVGGMTLFYCANAKAAVTTVTVTLSTTQTFDVIVQEFSGASTTSPIVSVTAADNQTPSTTPSCVSVTPAAGNAVLCVLQSNGSIVSVNAPFTLPTGGSVSAPWGVGAAYVLSADGSSSYGATFSTGSSDSDGLTIVIASGSTASSTMNVRCSLGSISFPSLGLAPSTGTFQPWLYEVTIVRLATGSTGQIYCQLKAALGGVNGGWGYQYGATLQPTTLDLTVAQNFISQISFGAASVSNVGRQRMFVVNRLN